jgi:Fe2+ transport system protein FeoA
MNGTLLGCRAGDCVVVGSIDGSAARIDKLAAVGILPGVELRVQQTRPVVVVESDETVLALERDIAAGVRVVPVTAGREPARHSNAGASARVR